MKLKVLNKFVIAILCITALLGSAYLVLAANVVRYPLDGYSTSLPFGGFTANSGVTIPAGTIEVTVNHGYAIMNGLTQSGQIRFTVAGQGTFTYTSDDATPIVYTGIAAFSGNGYISITGDPMENSQISFRATVTATGPNNTPFSFVLIAHVTFDQTGGMTFSVTSPNTDFSYTPT